MALPINPIEGEEFTTLSGKKFKYNLSTKTWKTVQSNDGISQDNTNTTTIINKVWSGTRANFQLITPASDIIYFVKD